MTLSRASAVVTALVLVGAAAAGTIWYRYVYEPERPLERPWEALVVSIAGGGTAGSQSPGPFGIRFSDPFGIASAPDGTIYVSDGVEADRVYRLAPDRSVTVIAGTMRGFADGPSVSARFDTPSGLAIDAAGTLYVADTGNDAIRRITPDGIVSTLAGPDAGLNGPMDVALDAAGRVIVADTYNDRVVAITPDGAVMSIAGQGAPGFEDGHAARFDTPCGVAVGPGGNIYVADTGNGALRMIAPDGSVSTIRTGYLGGRSRPVGIDVGPEGSVYVADAGGYVREISTDGSSRVVAGSVRGFADGPRDLARFRAPTGIAVVAPGRLLVTDRRNALVRLIAARSQIELRPPAPPMAPAFDAAAFDRIPLLWPFAPIEGPHEITGTLGEPRGSEGGERFHAGLDVHAVEGTPVHAVRDGAVGEPLAALDFGSLNESVRIGPLAYVHLRVGRDAKDRPFADRRFVATRDETGETTRVRVKRGARFRTGDAIGTVNRFYHAHLNVGWPEEEVNPLHFRLAAFEDTIPPAIVRGGIRVIGEDGVPFTERERRRIVVHGRVRVVVDAWDHVNGNLARRRLGLYRLGYELLDASGAPVPGYEDARDTIRFDRHPADDDAPIIYASGSGIPVYGRRSTRFLYLVTSSLRDGVAADGMIDTTSLPPGDYTIRIVAADIAGNEAVANRDLAIIVRRASAN